TREVDGEKVILPVCHGVGVDEMREYSPTLADRVAVSSDKGLEHVVNEILKAVAGSSTGVAQSEQMVLEESVYWNLKSGEREGPYCPVCYEDKRKAVHLNPGATKGKYRCGVCRNSFTTKEYDPRPVRRRPFRSR